MMIYYEKFRRRASSWAATMGLLLLSSGCSVREAALDGVYIAISDGVAGIVTGIFGGFLGM